MRATGTESPPPTDAEEVNLVSLANGAGDTASARCVTNLGINMHTLLAVMVFGHLGVLGRLAVGDFVKELVSYGDGGVLQAFGPVRREFSCCNQLILARVHLEAALSSECTKVAGISHFASTHCTPPKLAVVGLSFAKFGRMFPDGYFFNNQDIPLVC